MHDSILLVLGFSIFLLFFSWFFPSPLQAVLKHHLPHLQLIWAAWLSNFIEQLGSPFIASLL